MNHRIIFGLILLLGVFLRLISIDSHGIWYDEKKSIGHALGLVHSMEDSSFSIPEEGISPEFFWNQKTTANIAASTIETSAGNSIPYNILLSKWITHIGVSDFSVRALSVVFSILFMLVFYKMVCELSDDRTLALLAMFLVGIGHLNIQYAQEVRAYMLTELILGLNMICYIRYYRKTGQSAYLWLVLYVLSAMLAFTLHYMALIVFAGQAVYVVLGKEAKREKVLGLSISACFFIVFVYLFMEQTNSMSGAGENLSKWSRYAEMEGSRLGFGFGNLISFATDLLSHLSGIGFSYTELRVRQILPLLAIPAYLAWMGSKLDSNSSILRFSLSILIGHMLLSTFLSYRMGHLISFDQKYGIYSQPFITLTIAAGMLHLWRSATDWRKWVPGTIMTGIMIASSVPVWTDTIESAGNPFTRGPNPYSQSAERLSELDPGLVTLPSKNQVFYLSYYLKDSEHLLKTDSTNSDIRFYSGNDEILIFQNILKHEY